MLEETKKEVREIRSVEAQMKWNLAREEKKEKVIEKQEEETEIRDWRWRQSQEMKDFVEEKAQEVKVVELQESRDFQEFKREFKTNIKQEDLKHIQEVYETDVENAAWRAEQAHQALAQDKEVVLERVVDVQQLKEAKVQQKLQEKAEADEVRALEQTLEMAKLARDLAREKEQLLESLELTRAAGRAPPRPSTGRARP